MDTRWAFDLDGTLLDTKEAVRQAYRAVGVKMPPEAWGEPWTAWLHDKRLHDAKNRVYPVMLARYGQTMPLLPHAIRMNAHVLTGASLEAVQAIVRLHPALNIALTGANARTKMAWLIQHSFGGFYVDDNEHTRHIVKEYTTWTALSPEEALARLEPLAPSSLPLALTHGSPVLSHLS